MKRLDVTIVIPVRNEEENLPGCLDAIGKDLVEKIIIIDSSSTDKTREIAENYGVQVVNFVWNGRFPKKRNWFLQNYRPDTKWIFFLDADEYLTEAFKTELAAAVQSEKEEGYWLNYTIYFLGEKLKGGYPLKKLALFRWGAGEYERIEEEYWSNLDMEVHEHPVLKGPVGRFKSKIDHLDFRSIDNYIKKHLEYADWETARFLKITGDAAVRSAWTWKQRLKYRLMRTVWIGPAFFLGSFFILGGFRDGSRGFAFAILKMSYFNQVYCKIREYRVKKKEKNTYK